MWRTRIHRNTLLCFWNEMCSGEQLVQPVSAYDVSTDSDTDATADASAIANTKPTAITSDDLRVEIWYLDDWLLGLL